MVPAIFRLGTFYEKGLSVKKDVDIARRYYTQAAERGSAKAMHNLAVLDADGGGKGANYKSASTWFRKAADRGVADSQFNLGILYARGIGVEQNLANPSNGSASRQPRATRMPGASATTLPSASTSSRWRPPARDPDLYAGAAARRRHQRGLTRGRLGFSPAPAAAKPGARPARPSAPPPPIKDPIRPAAQQPHRRHILGHNVV